MLENKAGIWKSVDSWVFKSKRGDLIYIENSSKKWVLGAKSDGRVIQEVFVEGKAGQLWKKGKPNAEGFFKLENSEFPMVMSAMSAYTIEIRSKYDRLMCNPYVVS